MVAIKVVEHTADLHDSKKETLAEKIEREALLSLSISHPNIIATFRVCTVTSSAYLGATAEESAAKAAAPDKAPDAQTPGQENPAKVLKGIDSGPIEEVTVDGWGKGKGKELAGAPTPRLAGAADHPAAAAAAAAPQLGRGVLRPRRLKSVPGPIRAGPDGGRIVRFQVEVYSLISAVSWIAQPALQGHILVQCSRMSSNGSWLVITLFNELAARHLAACAAGG